MDFMVHILAFYILTFFISFLLNIPIGPVNIEVLHNAIKKDYTHAIYVAVGAAFGDGIWAMVAFFGISPFMSNRYLEATFLLFTCIITFILGISALKNSHFIEEKEEHIIKKIKRKRWSFLKGFTLILVNQLGIASWMICLSFLRKFNIYIPLRINYEIFFFIVVVAGATSYFLLVVFITNKMKKVFNNKRASKITKVLGYLLIAFSIYFLFYSIKLFFFNGKLISLPS